MITLNVNGRDHAVDVTPDTPLLWVLREKLGLTGTKYGCGISVCGACTVHVDGRVARSCVTAVADVEGKRITTIEGLAGPHAGPLREAWLAEEVSACGYCQPGQLMAAAALLADKPHPDDADIDAAMSGNICRCGTYGRIRRAIKRVSMPAPREGRK